MRSNLDLCGLFRLINLLPIFVLIPACQGDAGILSSARAGTGSGAERWPGQQGSAGHGSGGCGSRGPARLVYSVSILLAGALPLESYTHSLIPTLVAISNSSFGISIASNKLTLSCRS